MTRFLPAALEAFLQARERTRERVLADDDCWRQFHEYRAFNRYLKADSDTIDLFLQLHAESKPIASRVYYLAKDLLVGSQRYELCAHYSYPAEELRLVLESFRWDREELAGNIAVFSVTDELRWEFARKRLTRDAASLIALMAVTNQPQQAKKLAAQAKEAWDDEVYHQTIDNAIAGEFPKPLR
ncbi:hypothetical protein [Posidoniimonas polymericola]|uniref:hypothetical protein n=1 Tax=Posidoniimonas polymericola TaxID=2528002 RepID=UPI0011B6F9DC|nr:hypothetical protein [Posidoniimonas polymericola]